MTQVKYCFSLLGCSRDEIGDRYRVSVANSNSKHQIRAKWKLIDIQMSIYVLNVTIILFSETST
jgi:hypothetical protein